jgi:hypothetical protein
VSGLADAGHDQASGARMNERDGLRQVLVEAVAQLDERFDFLIDDIAGSFEGLLDVRLSHRGRLLSEKCAGARYPDVRSSAVL